MSGQRGVAWALGALLLAPSGCSSSRLRRDLRRGDLQAVQAAPIEARARLNPAQSRRYAQLLSEDGQIESAQSWWLGAYLRGGDLKALESLATSEATHGAPGFAAAHFAQVLASTRDAVQDRALACRLWRARMLDRIEAHDYVAALDDELRLRSVCHSRFLSPPHPELRAQAHAQARARVATPPLVYQVAPSLLPAFLDSAWIELRSGALSDRGHEQAKRGAAGARQTSEVNAPLPSDTVIQEWVAIARQGQGKAREARWYAKVGEDLSLGAQSAGYTFLLASAGDARRLDRLRDKMRASSTLQSSQSARFRVILALALKDREQSIFWMRLGASEMQDLGSWWLWCARWSAWMGQRDAARVAYQALAPLIAAGSQARWVLSWWRLRQRILDLRVDPYLRADAPHAEAQASLRALWEATRASLPQEAKDWLWPALVDDLVARGWSDAWIAKVGSMVMGPDQGSRRHRALMVSRALNQAIRQDPAAYLEHPSVTVRGAAWRSLWSQKEGRAQALARYWHVFQADSAWGPGLDPLAALSVLIARPLDPAGLE